VTLAVAAFRAGVAPLWAPFAVAIGWILPFASGTGLVPATAGALLIAAALVPIGVRVARMSDQAWAERGGRDGVRVRRTKRAKAPKIAVESAA
jgi:hypothetical protein